MAVMIPVEDGKIVDNSASADSLSGTKKRSNSSLDKEAFLQLLVAQMKYQDPLEPTSNTEYISQLATFSTLEEMQNMNATMQAQQASSLVGKTVIMKITNGVGDISYVSGRVDYIQLENSKTYVSIEGNLYNIDDLERVVDDEYMTAVGITSEFEEEVAKLPSVKALTLNDKDKLMAIAKAYDSLSDYQKIHIAKYAPESLKTLQELVKKMDELIKEAGGSTDDKDPDDDKTDGTEGTEGTEGTDQEGESK